MTILEYKDNKGQISQVLSLIKQLSPVDDTYEYLRNELLIYVYSSYENFLKKLLISLFSDAKKNYKYYPFLIEHNLWGVVTNPDKSFIVPKGKIEDLKANFPLIKESYFINELSAIDTLVIERNSFAHTGTHNATIEQILNAYITSNYIIKYLSFCYIESTDIQMSNLSKVQKYLNELSNHTRGCLKSIKEDRFSPNMTAFDNLYETYSNFKNDGTFECHPDILELSKERNFIFLSNYKDSLINDFKTNLADLEAKIYFQAFKVEDKDKLSISNILNIEL